MDQVLVRDSSTTNPVDVGDTANKAIRVNIVASSASSGGGLTDTELRATPVPVSFSTAQHVIVDSIPASGGGLTDTELRASPVPVSGPLTDTQLRASAVPVSGTITANAGSGPFPVSDNAGSLTVDAPVATPVFVRLSDGAAAITALPITDNAGSLTVDGSVTVTQATGTNLHAVVDSGTISTITNVVHVDDNAGSLTIDAANLDVALSTRLKPADTLTAVTTVGTITNPVTVTPPTLTKGTQGSTGFSVQELKDAGRTNLIFYATGVASGTTGTETAITLTKAADTSATSTGTSFVITNGKRFRISSITFGSRGNATATTQISTLNLRINTAGAVITTSTPLVMQFRTACAAVASAYDRMSIMLEDGLEFAGNGTIQFGVTANSVFVTNAPTWDILITGFEY